MSKETGWNANWPSGGLKPLWEGKVGVGYSSVSVAKGKLYTMGNIENEDHVFCFDAETGKPVWDHKYICSPKDPNGYHGTRVTPTINDGRAYTLSRNGHFFCLDADSGQVIWSKDFVKEFGAKIPQWGLAGSPLIEKDWVLTEVSGKDASVAAFDRKTGNLIWKNGSDVAGYASIIAFDLEGERCFVQFAENAVILRKMKDGAELWRAPWKTSYGVNAATPIIEGKDMFLSSGYGFGAARLSMTLKDSKEVWRNKNMKNHVNSCVLLEDW
jgi:outer membrane protein assembly factor BamB